MTASATLPQPRIERCVASATGLLRETCPHPSWTAEEKRELGHCQLEALESRARALDSRSGEQLMGGPHGRRPAQPLVERLEIRAAEDLLPLLG